MNPWRTMWVEPRQTVRAVIAENPNRCLWLLAAIYGFSSILNLFQSMAVGGAVSTWALVFLAAVLSPLWGYAVFAIWAWLISWTGKWLHGAGNFTTVRAAYAWSCVPLAPNALIWICLVLLLKGQLFQNFIDGHLLSSMQVTLLFVLLLAKMLFVIWAVVLYLNALAEVQKFSILKTILNVIIAGAIGAVVLIVLYSLLAGLMHMKEVSV
jgi:hypothetical protein